MEGLDYLDDFLLFGWPGSAQCADSLGKAMVHCQYLEVPGNPSKTEGPCTKLVFLDIELDTISLTMCLPQERLQREIRAWGGKKCFTKRELLSIIGQLQHACCLIKQGQSFLRRMIELSRGVRELHHRVHLNAGFRSDLQWWNCFLPFWNGSCPMAGVAKRENRWCSLRMPLGLGGAVPSLLRGSGSSWSHHRAGRGYTSWSKSCFLLCWAQQYGGASGEGLQCVACMIIQLWWPS